MDPGNVLLRAGQIRKKGQVYLRGTTVHAIDVGVEAVEYGQSVLTEQLKSKIDVRSSDLVQ